MAAYDDQQRRSTPGPDAGLPFFAYGLFKPGEIAFFQIKQFVRDVTPASMTGALLVRDGVVVLDRVRTNEVAWGYRIDFDRDAEAAYGAIQQMEPTSQYKWTRADGMNVLAAVKPGNGTRPLYGETWSGWRDPSFGPALEVVEESLVGRFDWDDFRPFYRLQAAYMLLWSSIERYVSLRYSLRKEGAVARVKRLADEPALVEALRAAPDDAVRRLRSVASSGRPEDKKSFDLSGDPVKLVDYLYHVRSNVTHRGKEAPLDWDLVHAATTEVLRSFRAALAAAELEARWVPESR